jgi:uncharacterized protein
MTAAPGTSTPLVGFEPHVSTSTTQRMIELDVIRAVALIGVVFNNFNGYLLIDSGFDSYQPHGVFDPWTGWFSTRFATTFVVVAGFGTTLLAKRARDAGGLQRTRMITTLVRRGLMLLIGGYFLEKIWEGTILPYYGLYFLCAAALFVLSTRALAAVAVFVIGASQALAWYTFERQPDWALGGNWQDLTGISKRLLLTGTHPLLPWLAFFIVGMLLGRMWAGVDQLRLAQVALLVMFAAHLAHTLWGDGELANRFLAVSPWGENPTPFGGAMAIDSGKSIAYTVATLGFALAAFIVVGALARWSAQSPVTLGLAAAGRMSLTLYVLHTLVYNAAVAWFEWLDPTGNHLLQSTLFTGGFWACGVLAAALWQRAVGVGPLEWLYRTLSQ